MNWVDIAVVAIILISIVIGAIRGGAKEGISLATWIAACFIAIHFAPRLAVFLPDVIEKTSFRMMSAFALLFISTMFVGGLVNTMVAAFVDKMGLAYANRAIGTLFGLIRGVIIVAVLVWLAGFWGLEQTYWWQHAKLPPYFERLIAWGIAISEEDVSGYLETFNLGMT